MKRKTALKIACAAVAAITAFSACACGDKGGGKVADVTIRSAISAVDVLADKSYDNLGAAKYEVTVARNEYESSQLIFTPDADVKSYKIEVADLYDASGNKFPKESFEIYHEKYINITTGSEGGSTGVGKYADAILPFDKAAEYGENKMTKGENQGVLITAYPSKTQPAGTYNGTFKLTADGKEYEIPAAVTVIDYTLTDEVNSRSVAVMSRHYMTRYDDTVEAYKAYYETALKYRLNVNYLPCPYENYDIYVQTALEYVNNPKVSTYCLPYSEAYNSAVNDTDADWDKLETLIKKLYAASVENNVDLLKKAVIYFATLMDEAEISGRVNRAIRMSNDAEKFKQKMADYFATQGSDALHESLIASIKSLPVLATDRYYARLWNNGEGVKYYCPMVNYFSSQSERDVYESLGEQGYEYWWYTATGPHNPTPNWHTDSLPIGMRMIAWMQKEYGVSGFLYWDLVSWNSSLSAYGNGNIDPYEVPATYGMVENGDGRLFYPGVDYGMTDPVGCMRLERIRDGQEEFEMLKEINDVTTALDPNADADKGILKLLYDKLYADAKIRATSYDFMKVRRELDDLAIFAQKFGGAVTEANLSGDEYSFTIKAADGVSIEVNGNAVPAQDGKFVVKVSLSGDSNALAFTAVKGDERYAVNVGLGGRITSLNPIETEEDVKEFTTNNGTISLDTTTGGSFGLRDGKFVKIALGEATKSRQSFVFESDKLRSLDEKTLNISMMIYTRETETFTVEVSAKIEGDPIMESVGSFDVVPRAGRLVTLSGMADLNWEKCSGKITALYFYVGAKGDAARTLYIDDVVCKNR